MSPLGRRLSAAAIALAIAGLAAAYAVPRLGDVDSDMSELVFEGESLYNDPRDLKIAWNSECLRLAAQYFDTGGCKSGAVEGCWRKPGTGIMLTHVLDGCIISLDGDSVYNETVRIIHARSAAPRRVLAMALAVAFAIFWAFALTSETGSAVTLTVMPQSSPEGEEAAQALALRRGARLKAARKVQANNMKHIEVYRFAQVANAIFAVGLLNTVFMPTLAETLLLVFWGVPVLVALGLGTLLRPTWFVALPGSTLAGHPSLMPWKARLVLVCSAAAPWLWVAVVAPIVACIITGKPLTTVVVGGVDVGMVLKGLVNWHAITQWVMQGTLALIFAGSLFMIGFLATLVFTFWTLCLLCRGACGLRSPLAMEAEKEAMESLRKEAREIEEQILKAASARLAMAKRGTSGAAVQEGTANLLAPTIVEDSPAEEFPPDVKAEVAVEGPLPSCIGEKLFKSFRFAWLPGGLYKALTLLVTDVVLDFYFSEKLIWQGHYYFGGIMGAFALTSTMLQVRRGLWGRLLKAVEESLASGIMTEDYLEMQETERSMETLPAAIVTFYAMPFMGMATVWDILPAIISLGLSIHGVASYIVDTVDLDLGLDRESA